jgi:putative membrane protein insertion efficiency factor
VNRFFIFIIRLYKRYLSPFLPAACRFTPTCSEYAAEAFETQSFFRAFWMTVVRIAKCHPFHAGGYDPVTPGRGSRSSEGVPLPLPAGERDVHRRS